MTRIHGAFTVAGLFLMTASCGWVAPLSEPDDAEQSIEECQDGVDNDLDGREDCDDPSCSCDGCDPPARRLTEADTLGLVCSRSCECRYAALAPDVAVETGRQVCNPFAWLGGQAQGGRCIEVATLSADGESSAGDNAFSIDFRLELNAAGESQPVQQRQNVVGVVQFQGQTFTLSSALWRRQSISFCEGSCRFGDNALEILLSTPVNVEAMPTVRIDDGIGAGRTEVALRTQLGPFTGDFDAQVGFNQVAVVQTATLSVWLVDGGLIAGRLAGRLRPSGAIDRAKGGSCGADLFHPDLQACFPPAPIGLNAFFTFGCLLDPAAPEMSGRALYGWSHPWVQDVVAVRADGRCVAQRTSEGVEVRLATNAMDNPETLVEMTIPEAIVAPGTTVAVGPEQQARVTVYRIATQRRRLFDIDLSEATDTRVVLRGRLALEQVDSGAPPRLFGWLEGGIAQ